ncbi:uncharacterized protein MONOS_17998 [Monocercomonoides exilis]|uniref:uncharacterized protein n=1 Tax=Monocercomonoides exilis TaxID=2049356 RepID=UPI00355A1319|nr:hypothetical protein MONOS_17998 [Monocercomonoides exilis]
MLKVASSKEESEEATSEVEIALLSLNNCQKFADIEKELYLEKMTEIIKYHQEHQNLTHLAYQSAWGFLIDRFYYYGSLEKAIVDELHPVREAIKELYELERNINWMKKEEEMKSEKCICTINRWLKAIKIYFSCIVYGKEGLCDLIARIVSIEGNED